MRPSWNVTNVFQFATSCPKEPKLKEARREEPLSWVVVLRRREQEPHQGKDEEQREESRPSGKLHATEPAPGAKSDRIDRMI